MSEDKFLLPERLAIISPMPSVKPRGRNSDKSTDPSYTIRIPNEHRNDIETAAIILGMKPSSFVRWAAHAAAIEVHRHHDGWRRRNKK